MELLEVKPYPNDFYSRKFSVILVKRVDHESKPTDFAEYAEMLNLKLSLIESLAFMLDEWNENSGSEINPTNLRAHIKDVLFLIRNFASSMHLEGELELFLKTFE